MEERSTDTLDGQKDTQGVLEQRKPETWLEAQMPTLKLSSYFEHTTRQQRPLEKTVMRGKWKAAGKEGAHG